MWRRNVVYHVKLDDVVRNYVQNILCVYCTTIAVELLYESLCFLLNQRQTHPLCSHKFINVECQIDWICLSLRVEIEVRKLNTVEYDIHTTIGRMLDVNIFTMQTTSQPAVHWNVYVLVKVLATLQIDVFALYSPI